MISSKISALFTFIDYLDRRKTELIETYTPLCAEISELDIKRRDLKPQNNYNDKLLYDVIQKQISEKFEPITEFIYKPIAQKLIDLEIWSGDDVYCSIWNNNIGAISELKQNFTLEDVNEIVNYKTKYLNFRKETDSSFLCLGMILSNLDEILKELFDYFKDTTENEFDIFEKKIIEVNSIEEAVSNFQNNQNRNVAFSIPHESLYNKPEEQLSPAKIIFIKNQYNMGDVFNGIYNSTIYNKSTFTDAFNSVKANYTEDSANALEIVRTLVENSKSQEAGELFDSFNEEIKKEKPKPSVLQSLWSGLIKVVPMITETVGLVDKILPLIQR